METDTQALILSPENVPVLSKQNAQAFHQAVKQRIFDTGTGLFEYLETVKFFSAIDKQISGDSNAKIEPDKEFISYAREEIKRNSDKDKFTSQRGVKFELAEVGTSYDFSQCGDAVLTELEAKAKDLADQVKARKEFLKTVPTAGMVITDENSGETFKVFPPSKTSKSSFKISLPK